MRVSREVAAANRERILAAAARLFREHGLSGVGVDALAEASGLTHGSVYSQFGSKERLAVAALGHAMEESAQRMRAVTTLEAFVTRYLSPDHRDGRGEGCVMAALAAEIPRQASPLRHGFTAALRMMAARISALLPRRPAEAADDEALAIVSTLVGALALARAVDDPGLSDRILAAARARLTA